MKLRLVLGDQLNINHSWFKEKEEDTIYVLIELHQEAHYVVHHIQKIVAFFSAMRHFSQQKPLALKEMIENTGVKTIGSFDKNQFLYPLSRLQALEQLDYFCRYLLVHFEE